MHCSFLSTRLSWKYLGNITVGKIIWITESHHDESITPSGSRETSDRGRKYPGDNGAILTGCQHLLSPNLTTNPLSPLVLSQMFSLTNAQIHALISKMILNDELKASWDKPTDLLMLHRAESSKLQSLTKQTADKVITLYHYLTLLSFINLQLKMLGNHTMITLTRPCNRTFFTT